MSNKPTTGTSLHHDGTAPNCVNHLAVVAFGHRPNRDRVCTMPECMVPSDAKPSRTRRRATRP